MRAGKPLPVLYTPFTEGREASFSVSTEIRFMIEQMGTVVFGCAYPCVMNFEKEGPAMSLERSINYYYAVLALRLLLEKGLISQEEYGKICRYNAEIFRPEREYI